MHASCTTPHTAAEAPCDLVQPADGVGRRRALGGGARCLHQGRAPRALVGGGAEGRGTTSRCGVGWGDYAGRSAMVVPPEGGRDGDVGGGRPERRAVGASRGVHHWTRVVNGTLTDGSYIQLNNQ